MLESHPTPIFGIDQALEFVEPGGGSRNTHQSIKFLDSFGIRQPGHTRRIRVKINGEGL